MNYLKTRLLALILLPGLSLSAQTLDVTFRYIPKPDETITRIFVPGTMPEGTSQDWGPNTSGVISPSAPSIMELNILNGTYERMYPLTIGETYQYKFHIHENSSGTNYTWLSDPLNPLKTNDGYQNSILTVTDPLVFQPGLHFDTENLVTGLSAGIFSTNSVDSIFIAIGNDTVVDGLAYYNDTSGIFYYDIVDPRFYYEGFNIKAFIDSITYSIFNIKAIDIVESSLPEGVEPGPNFDGQTLTVVVLAPSQPLVQLSLSTISNPQVDTLYTLNRDPELTDVWWLSIDGLPAGDYSYAYQLINGTRVSDPFSRRVVDGRTVVNIGSGGITTADNYSWSDENFTIPHLDTLFIYELHVDDFTAMGSAKGRFTYVIDKLNHLKEIGVNAIELMPIMEFPGSRNWGYHTTHYAAVENTYGTPEDFKQLINEAHLRGMAVLLDIVWNHANSSNPIWGIQPNIALNPYIKADSDLRPNEDDVHFGGVDLDHFTTEMQAFIRQVHNIWVEEYHIDGFRFDFTRGIGWAESQPGMGILGWSTALRNAHPEVIQIIEHLPSDTYLVNNFDFDAGWHDSFHDRLKDEIFQSNSMETIENQVVGLREYDNNSTPYLTHNSAVKYSVSHDEQSLIQEMVEWKGHSLEKALRRDLMFLTLLFTSQGIPMIWQGQEFGMKSGWLDADGDGDWDDDKLAYRAMDWALQDSESGQRHYYHLKNLSNIYRNHPAVRNGYFSILERYPSQKTIVYGNTDPANSHGLIVFANLGASPATITNVPVFYNGIWYPVLGGGEGFTASGFVADTLNIPAYTAYIHSNVEWETLVIEDVFSGTIPENFSLQPAYPNPFNAKTTIPFSLAVKGNTNLRIFNILGEQVDELLNLDMPPGQHSVSWNCSRFPSGIYYFRLSQGNHMATGKLLLLK